MKKRTIREVDLVFEDWLDCEIKSRAVRMEIKAREGNKDAELWYEAQAAILRVVKEYYEKFSLTKTK